MPLCSSACSPPICHCLYVHRLIHTYVVCKSQSVILCVEAGLCVLLVHWWQQVSNHHTTHHHHRSGIPLWRTQSCMTLYCLTVLRTCYQVWPSFFLCVCCHLSVCLFVSVCVCRHCLPPYPPLGAGQPAHRSGSAVGLSHGDTHWQIRRTRW